MLKSDSGRFITMYDEYYPRVEKELANGRKESHWMWFIFPQIKGLGNSKLSMLYAIQNIDEAKTFLNSSCGVRMLKLLEILLGLEENNPEKIFGCIDARKMKSSMTLFSEADSSNPLFCQVLDKFYEGEKDEKTLTILCMQRNECENTALNLPEKFAAADERGGTFQKQENKKELFNRFKGMFWGLVIGDCLGSPIQFMDKDNHPYITEMKPCRHFNTPAGYWTDDASMAFCVAESLVRLKKYELPDIANNFVRWYNDGFYSSLPYAFDVGGATCHAVNSIARGSLRNGIESSQGNGSIMRFAPSYIWNYGNSDRKILHEISDLTHWSSKIRETVDLMADICDEHLSGERTAVKSLYKTREEVNNSGWAVSTLQAALWAFETTETFEDGMIAAVNLGGDADSIGAVYGQIAGAFYGFDAIPERWLSAVKDRHQINELIENLIAFKISNC